MLRAVAATNGPISAAPLPVREAQGAGSPTVSGSQAGAPIAPVESRGNESSVLSTALSFRYNSTEFVYRQDIGRIVLIGQSPETGERTIQIPSEEALRAYERTIRAEERQQLIAANALPQPSSGSGVAPAPQPLPAPSLQQAIGAVFGADQGSAVVSVSA